MKAKVLIVVTSLVMLFTSSAIAGTQKKSSRQSPVAQFIQKNIHYPETTFGEKLEECCVWVEITIKDDGHFQVTNYNGSQQIKNSLISDIEHLKPAKEDFSKYAGQKVLLKIIFKLL